MDRTPCPFEVGDIVQANAEDGAFDPGDGRQHVPASAKRLVGFYQVTKAKHAYGNALKAMTHLLPVLEDGTRDYSRNERKGIFAGRLVLANVEIKPPLVPESAFRFPGAVS